MAKSFSVEILRFDPQSGSPAEFQSFEVPYVENMRVLDVIRSVYEEQADDLAFQYSCRIGRCGTCTMRVNGVPVLACQERAKPVMRIEPIGPFPVLRDLVVDRSEVDRRYADLHLVPERGQPHSGVPEAMSPKRSEDICELDRCIACMICVAACPAVAERPFDGPALMLKLRQLSLHPGNALDRANQAIQGGLLECFGCDACTELCPADLSPAQAIRELRREAIFGKPR